MDCGRADTAEGELVAENIGPTDPTPFDTSEAFLLHSRPGADRVIYLDFDGHADTSGRWKAGAKSPPFDLDGNEATFNSTERNRIIGIWQRVAEDFSMYDINVTTEDPGLNALRKTSPGDSRFGVRVVIGGSSSDWFGNPVGAVAFVGSFDANADIPCWVFPKSPGSGTSEKNIAEAGSHEVGHTLGLLHDGLTGGGGTYTGHGNWGPIMGVSYTKSMSQWSKGEYANANNTQDDLAVMLTQGAVYRPDDHGGSVATATELTADDTFVSVSGVIERNTDLDFFKVNAAGGSLVIDVAPAPRGPNLRLAVKLYDSGGSLLQTATASDTSNGTQPVTLNRSVAAGVHYVSVEGIGNGNPLTTGYSDYASIGQYDATITGVVPGGFTWLPATAGTWQWNTAANWASAILPNGAGSSVRVNNDITGNQNIQLGGVTTLGTLFLGDANGTHRFTLEADSGSLVFNNAGNPAEPSKTTGATDVISAPVVLADGLDVTQSAPGALEFSGGISGSGSLTKSGAGTVVFNAANTYAGTTTLADGLLRLDDPDGLPGGIDHSVGAGESGLVFNGGVLGITGDFTRDLGTGGGQLNWDPDHGAGSGGFAASGADREVRLNDVTGAATLHLGGASSVISFADSSSMSWTGTLDLTGTFVPGASIRFGTDGSGLDASQLARLSAAGFGSFALNSNGYLTAVPVAGYSAWKAANAPDTGSDPAADEDGDGVANAVEYVLGGSIHTNDIARLPRVSTSGGNMLFSFKRDQASIDGLTTIEIETGPDLVEWPAAYPVPDGAASNIPGVSVIKDDPPGYDTVTLALPASADLWKFVRLKVTP